MHNVVGGGEDRGAVPAHTERGVCKVRPVPLKKKIGRASCRERV